MIKQNLIRHQIAQEVFGETAFKHVYPRLRPKTANLPAKISKNGVGITVFNTLSGQKKAIESHNAFDLIKPKPNIHGVVLNEAVMGFSRSVRKKMHVLTGENLQLVRDVKKDIEKGLMQIDYRLEEISGELPKILGFKRKTIEFAVKNREFIKKNRANVFTVENTDAEHILTNAIFDKHANPHWSKLSTEEMQKFHNESFLEFYMEGHFGDRAKDIARDNTGFRDNLVEGLTTNDASSMYFDHDPTLKLFMRTKDHPNAVTKLFRDDLKRIRETHNIYRNKNANIHGIPTPQTIVMYLKDKLKSTFMMIDKNTFINRQVFKDPNKGMFNIHYILTKRTDKGDEIISELMKLQKFEMENGKFKKLLNRSIQAYDVPERIGFATRAAKSETLGAFKTAGLTQEENTSLIFKKAYEYIANKTPKDKLKQPYRQAVELLENQPEVVDDFYMQMSKDVLTQDIKTTWGN